MIYNIIKYNNKSRIYHLIIDIILVIFFVKIYRPYVYINNINDYHIADSISSLFATLIMCNFICIKDKNVATENLLYVFSVVTGLLIYEFTQYCFNIGTYDIFDIIFTFIGGILSFLMNKYYLNKSSK